jgi:RHS repeat-associated protein
MRLIPQKYERRSDARRQIDLDQEPGDQTFNKTMRKREDAMALLRGWIPARVGATLALILGLLSLTSSVHAQTYGWTTYSKLVLLASVGTTEADGKFPSGIQYSAKATGYDAISKIELREGNVVLDSVTYTVNHDKYGEPVNVTRASTRSARFGVGVHQIYLRSYTDGGGMDDTPPFTVTVSAPNTTPTATLASPSNGATFTLSPGQSTMSVGVSGSGFDPDGNLSLVAVLVDDVTAQQNYIGSGTSASVSTSVTVGAGTHTVQVSATDTQYATGFVTATFTVFPAPNSAPTASISAPANGAVIAMPLGASSMALRVAGSGADIDGNLSGLQLRLDGGVVANVGGGALDTNVTIGAGAHTLQLIATDGAGATGSASVSFTINATPNTAPAAVISAPANGSAVTLAPGITTTSVRVIAAGSDVDGNLSGLQLKLDGNVVSNVAGGGIDTTLQMGAGGHTLQLIATDSIGATGSASVTFTVNLAADNGAGGPPLVPVNITPPHLGNADAGSLPGGLTLGGGGDASYSIALAIPPGSAGMAPDLALRYSSHGSDGLAGLGWTVSGSQSSIHRCAKTVAQDGQGGRIRMDSADRLCLDGQRLMRADAPDTSDSAYWAAGGEFRFEIENFTRVTRYGGGFKVEQKNGRVLYYGTTAASQIIATGRGDGALMNWALARVEDRKGNFMSYDYSSDATTGEYLTTSIFYGGNPNAAGAARFADLAVRFVYEARPDAFTRYTAGSRTDLRSRITHIRAYAGIAADGTGGTLVRDYTLSYRQGDLSGASLLTQVQGCATNARTGGTECLPPSVFDYGNAGALTYREIGTAPATVSFADQYTTLAYQGDLDNSGRTSYLAVNNVKRCSSGLGPCPSPDSDPESRKAWPIFTSQLRITMADGRVIDRTMPELNGLSSLIVTDLNGDGRDDLVLMSVVPATARVAAYCLNQPGSDGAPQFVCTSWFHPLSGTQYEGSPPSVVDMNNDRRMHLLFGHQEDCSYQGPSQGMACVPFQVTSTTAPLPPFTSILDQPFFRPSGVAFGRSDVSDLFSVWSKRTSTYPVGATGITYQGVTVCFAGTTTLCTTPYQAADTSQFNLPALSASNGVGDLNGDGLTDFAYVIDKVGTFVCLSRETSIDCRQVSTPWSNTSSLVRLFIGDFVGDGRARLFASVYANYPDEASVQYYGCRLADAALQCSTVSGVVTNGFYGASSLTGSGVGEFRQALPSASTPSTAKVYSMAAPANADKLIGVTNGVGMREEVDYARGSDATVYQRFVAGRLPVYPQISRSAGVLAARMRHANGQGGWRAESFSYAGAMSDAFGRGSLGFSQVRSIDAATGISTTNDLMQTFPYIGTATLVEMTTPGGVKLSSNNITPAAQNIRALPGSRSTVFTYTAQQTISRNDLNGDGINFTTDTREYGDGWGNLTKQTLKVTLPLPVTNTPPPDSLMTSRAQDAVVAGGGLPNASEDFVTVTSSVYANDGTGWLLGLPTTVATTRTVPFVGSVTRTVSSTFDPATGLPMTQTIEPGTPALQVVTTFDRSRNAFGQINATTQSWTDPSPVNGGPKSRVVSDVDFDERGRFATVKRNALGQAETYGVDAWTGAVTSLKTINGQTSTTEVDAFGRVVSTTGADGTVTRQYRKQCDSACPVNAVLAAVTEVFNSGSRIQAPQVQYQDSAGHVLTKKTWGFDGRAIVQNTRYDALGRVWEIDQPRFESDAAYLSTRTDYDDLGRVTAVTSRDDSGVDRAATTIYRGLIRELRDAKNQLRTESRNLIDQLVSVVDAKSGATGFGYEPFGQLARATDPNGNVVNIGYDRLGRRTELNDPDLGRVEYGVDPLGQVWWQRTPNQRAMTGQPGTRTEFDLLGRMTGRYEPDLESHWVYDTAANGVGQLAEAYTGPASAKDYRRLHTYDGLGRPSTTTQVLTDGNYTSTPLYDAWARPAGVTLQRGSDAAKAFTEGYNAQGYLNRINRNGETIWQVLEQDALQRVTRTQAGNGLTQLRTFSVHSGRPLMHWLTTSASAMRLLEQYQYDMLGNITQRQLAWDGSGFTESFDYDPLNRLKWSQVQGLARMDYDYDGAGNLVTKTGVGTYTYPAQGESSIRPHAVSSINDGAGGITSFGYDDNGNLLTGAQRTVTWTTFDMVKTIGKVGAPTATFIYGPEHQRARQLRSDGGYTLYAGLQEVESQGGVLKVRTYWPMGLGFEVDQPGVQTQKYWRYMDWLGSPVALTDASGNLVEKLAYDPWGQRRTLDGSATPSTLDGVLDNKGFTGHEMLDQLDLVHMNGRIYDPRVARFMSADPHVSRPESGQGYNRFSYVENNPTNATDPSGFDAERRDEMEANKGEGRERMYATKSAVEERIDQVNGAIVIASAGKIETSSPIKVSGMTDGDTKSPQSRQFGNGKQYDEKEYPGKGSGNFGSKEDAEIWGASLSPNRETLHSIGCIGREATCVAATSAPIAAGWLARPLGKLVIWGVGLVSVANSDVPLPLPGPSAAAAATRQVVVTEETIAKALATSTMKTTQAAVSRPAVENYVRRLEAGQVAPPIKVDGSIIVDGNHRYVAGRLVGREPAQTAGTVSPSQATRARPVQDLKVDPNDWGNR